MSGKGYLDNTALHAQAKWRSALLTYPGNLQEALREAQKDPKKTMFGIAQGIPSSFLTKVYAFVRPDFVWIDVEHGMFDRIVLHDAIHAAQHHSEGKTMALVRVPKEDEWVLTTALDAGAAGIIIPHSESKEEVEEFMKKIYYPPLGNRSFSPWVFTPGISDASLYPDDAFNMKTSNTHVAAIRQIESVQGISNVEEIASMPGVSALMFGPGDFMADAGVPLSLGEPHPTLVAAMESMSKASKKYNVPLWGAATNLDMVPQMIESGYRAIMVLDVWSIANMVKSTIEKAKESITI
ncbi:Pyruvate/Phosphoenolpyruvate kinase-like domain-containing protein [Trichoderma asperelloides]|nr:Pyruvate/Phosphoenolpyruvate kinase-like domain-containing protein [Trichoderma asperelloides]